MKAFVVLKLTTGEQLMATLRAEDDKYIDIANPMQVRIFPTVQEGHRAEQVTVIPFCNFTTERDFTIPKTCVMFVKPLATNLIPSYLNIVRQYSNSTVRTEQEESEELTTEEINRRLDMLESLLNREEEDTEMEEEETTTFVEGNDTFH